MKEDFDDILRRKWEEQHFPVDANHRAEMIELLNGKKRRGLFPFWWLGGLLLVTALAGLLLFKANEPVNSSIDHHLYSEKPFNPGIHGEAPVAADQNQSHITTNPERNSLLNNEVVGNSNKKSIPSSAKRETPSTTKDIAPPKSANTNLSSTSMKVGVEKTTPDDSKANIPGSEPDRAAIMPDGTYRVDEGSLYSTRIVSDAIAVTVEEDPYFENLQPAESCTRSTELIDFIEPLDVSGIAYPFNQGPGLIIPEVSYHKSLYVFGEAGVGIIFASKPDFSSGWKLRAGAGLGYRLSPNLQLSWGAGYQMQAGGFDFERSSTVNQPGFGTRSSFNTLTPDRLHFVYTRLGAQYRISRHVLGVHGGIQWLYGAQGTIVIHLQDQFAPDLQESSEYTWVKTDGLRELHWTADISYGYQLTPRLLATAGTDIYFSSFTVTDPALEAEGYYWNGAFSALHPFITLNYLIYGN